MDSYALIVDAGSTGSRLYMYHVDTEGGMSGGVSVTRGKKVRPGLAAFVKNASEAVEQMQFLIADGLEMVPSEKRATTRAMIRCTGGVRDELNETERRALLEAIGAGLSGEEDDSFDVGVVSGHDEAFYSFTAANFLEKRIDHNLKPTGHLIGALDLGGSSTQITFATSISTSETIDRSSLFAKSFAGLGAQAVREKLFLLGLKQGHDPCSHVGFVFQTNAALRGSGDFDACAEEIRSLILTRPEDCDQSLPSSMRRNGCSIDHVPIEKLPTHTTFLAMCNFFYAADAIRALADSPIDNWPTPNLDQLENAARAFCALPWNVVATTMRGIHSYTPDHLLPSRCFDAAYILVLLRNVYALDDFPRVTFALDANGGADVEWTLGYYLSEILQLSTNDDTSQTTH